MTTIIWLTARENGTCKSRYKKRRQHTVQIKRQEKILLKKVACALSGCNERVLKTSGK